MNEKICLATLKILLTPKEMRNVLGGSGDSGSYCCTLKACNGWKSPCAPNLCFDSIDAAEDHYYYCCSYDLSFSCSPA